MKTVILGSAHGSNVSGKCSPDMSIREYIWSREMCVRIKAKLDALGINCIIDSLDPIEKSLNARVKYVNQLVREAGDDCIYVSVHLNAAGGDGQWHNATGWTIWIYNKASQKSKNLSLELFEVAKEKNLFGNRYIPATKYFTANFAVLRDTICPAVLTENMFQDNKKDVEYLLSEEGKEEIANLHVEGISNYIEKYWK